MGVFEDGNKAGEKWTLEQATHIFEDLLKFAAAGDKALCIDDVTIYARTKYKLPRSTFYNLCDLHPALDNIKKEINSVILAKINRGGLNGDYTPALSIWRLKQLGETDKQELKVDSTTKNETPDYSKLSDDEIRKLIELSNKLNK